MIKQKVLKNGFSLPIFGLGTYAMGEGDETQNQKEITAIRQAVELGIAHIDTAEVYANGRCEKLVGEAVKFFDRKTVFLTSKVQATNLSYAGIKQALQNSLERLKTDYIDLYLMHRCPEEEKFSECVQALNELVAEGLIRHIGLSNTNALHSKKLCTMSKEPFVVNQVHLNLQFREPEKDGLVDFCQNNDIFLEAWRPVNKGALTKTGVNITKPGIPILDELCEKYHKTPAQISINWLVSQRNITTLAKSTNIDHLKENLGALDWEMEKADIEKLRHNFPGQMSVSDTVPLA